MCQRCETTKAASKVTIDSTVLKLCTLCAQLVQTDQRVAAETVAKAGGNALGGSVEATGPCELCRQRPQHVRTATDQGVVTVCAQCMAQQPFFLQLTRYAVACVAQKEIQLAKSSFEEMLMLSPEHPPTLYNCACVRCYVQLFVCRTLWQSWFFRLHLLYSFAVFVSHFDYIDRLSSFLD